MRIKLVLAYDGTDFCGWQTQKNGKSVQSAVEAAIKSLTGECVKVVASGRTDAGVHAEGQTLHFDTDSTIPPENFYKALNVYLPPEIRAVKSERAAENFNARKSAKKKTYEYNFYVAEVENPLKERYALNIRELPDIRKMQRAANLFVGEKDFKAFCATGSSVQTTVRTIYKVKVAKTESGFKIAVTGGGFLYNMVRIIAGTLLSVGQNKLTEADVITAFTAGDRKYAGKTLPAKGLTLKSVRY
ncbi:MAG TPA: tRNA pseudouridine(38-40) synthase TruA [Clostridiales bacterium]|nr:tRNA pseudouridine(38-40) synthase TruA [Clostridiales bacterium]